MLTPACGEPGQKPQGRRACLEEPSRVAGSTLQGGECSPGAGEGCWGPARGRADAGSPLSPFLPISGAAAGQKSQQRFNSIVVLLL